MSADLLPSSEPAHLDAPADGAPLVWVDRPGEPPLPVHPDTLDAHRRAGWRPCAPPADAALAAPAAPAVKRPGDARRKPAEG